MNLFSSFDPSNFFLNFNWYKFLFILFFLTVRISKFSYLTGKLAGFLSKEFKVLSLRNLRNLIVIPLFASIVILNLLSLLPFSFSVTAQISSVFPLAFTFWFSIFLFSVTKLSVLIVHLVPEGRPFPLIPFLVIIELTRRLIRPLTLSIRLVANIVAGHLLIHLLTNLILGVNQLGLIALFPLLLVLRAMELGVSVIQGYIFSSLLALYSNEIH